MYDTWVISYIPLHISPSHHQKVYLKVISLVQFTNTRACLVIQSVAMQKEHVEFSFSYVIMCFSLYCIYDCNPWDVLFTVNTQITNHRCPQKCDWRRSAGLHEEGGVSSANTLCEVKHQRVYKDTFLLSGAHKRDISHRGGELTMWTSAVLLVLLAVASHTVASEYRGYIVIWFLGKLYMFYTVYHYIRLYFQTIQYYLPN